MLAMWRRCQENAWEPFGVDGVCKMLAGDAGEGERDTQGRLGDAMAKRWVLRRGVCEKPEMMRW
jgi:hypothetical protein